MGFCSNQNISLSALKRFLKDTVIYGLATVTPRLMNLILVRLHTDALPTESYAENTSFYVYAAFFNVLLTYGMETAFFRFYNSSANKKKVFTTILIALTTTALLFLVVTLLLGDQMAAIVRIEKEYLFYLIGILVLDTLVVAPFAYLRAIGRPLKFTGIKLTNLFIYVILNFFFLWAVPKYAINFPGYGSRPMVVYIFIANLAASAITFLLLTPYFFKFRLRFDPKVFKQLWTYGWPIMVAGLAFVVNENLDKLLLEDMLDKDIMGAYAGCYKLAVFMTIFIQAFRLGAEPFFFNHAKNKDAPETYAVILKYFVVVGAFGLLMIVSFIDPLKELLIRDETYWRAIGIVPIILLANLCLGVYHNLSIWYKLTDKTRFGMYISIFGAVITIVFNVVMIPKIGFMASAWATLAAYGSMMVISYIMGRKHYPVPYNLKRIGLYLGLATAFSALSFYNFRGNYLLGSGLLLVFLGVVFFLEKREIKNLSS